MEEERMEKARTMRDRMEKMADGAIPDILNEENYESYLGIVARFPHFDYLNAVLVWLQDRDARFIASDEACRHLGKEAAGKKILLLAPSITHEDPAYERNERGEILCDDATGTPVFEKEIEFKTELLPMPYRSISDVQEDEFGGEDVLDCFIRKLKQQTPYTYYEGTERTRMPTQPFCILDVTQPVVMQAVEVHPEATVDQRKEAVIKGMVKAKFMERRDDEEFDRTYLDDKNANDRENYLQTFTTTAVMLHFGLMEKSNAVKRAVRKLSEMSHEEGTDTLAFMRDFLNELCLMSKIVISALTREFLTFNQVNIAKRFFFTENYVNVYLLLSIYYSQETDPFIRGEIAPLRDYVVYMSQAGFSELVRKVADHTLFIYPTTYVTIPETLVPDEEKAVTKKVGGYGSQEQERDLG